VRPLRVLFVNENVGGHSTVHLHLERMLAERADIDPVFLHVPPASGIRRLAGARLPVLGRLDLDLQPLREQLARSAWVARRLRTLASDVDVVHLYSHNAALLAVPTMRRTPSVVTSDSTNALNAYCLPHRAPTRFTPWTVRASAPLERRVHEAARLLVANSAKVAASLRQDYAVPEDRIRVLPFGVDAPSFPSGPAPGTAARRPTLVFVGRQLARKGGLQLLRLHRDHFADRADLVLVTTEPVPEDPGVRVVDDLRPGDPRLWDLLRGSSVFVFPTEIDQSPNVILEAMAAGLPVVSTDVGAIPEMVADGVAGRLVRPRDDAGLLDAIRSLLDDAAARQAMGAAAQQAQRARYDMRQRVDELVTVLRTVAGSSPARVTG